MANLKSKSSPISVDMKLYKEFKHSVRYQTEIGTDSGGMQTFSVYVPKILLSKPFPGEIILTIEEGKK